MKLKHLHVVALLCSACCLFFFTYNSYSSESIQSSSKKILDEVTPQEAQAASEEEKLKENIPSGSGLESYVEKPSTEFVRLAWEASAQGDLVKLSELVDQCVELYGTEANLQQSTLDNFPSRTETKNYQSLNDVATCLFIKAEALMNKGQTQDAVDQFQYVIDHFKWAQAWDPRGWYWSVAEKSQASIDVLTGKYEDEIQEHVKQVQRTLPVLHAPGKEQIVDYTKYGKFLNVGTADYHYSITDIRGLADAVGEGIYPNTAAIYNDPRYKALKEEGRLKGSHWDFSNTDDLEAAFYKWAMAEEPWGVRLFYIGMIFEKAGMYYEAIKAYHALIVHYPKTVAWTYWQTPWYPGQAAIAKIRYIIRMHPELNIYDKWMKIEVQNGYDNNVENDIIVTYPGKIVEKSLIDKTKTALQMDKKIPLGKVKKRLGKGKVHLVQYENKHWQLIVDNKPYFIHGITYAPTKVGQSPDKGTLKNWMEEDTNANGLIDGPFDAWVDANRNNMQDSDEPVVGDFQLFKEMGVNTIRVYHIPETPNKELLRDLYKKYGIRVIMGDFLGKYAIGSGATWAEGTDYENPEHKKNMLESVKKMVMEFKDEPYVLLWVLGNENNYGVACNADKKPEAYFKFVDEVAKWIKSVDKNHPVAVNNGDILYLDVFAKHAPNVDIFAANVYRGNYGFGSFWEQVSEAADRPAFISEFGSPAYAHHLTLQEAEDAQAEYHKGNWIDIEENSAGYARGAGSSIGGVVFEYLDEWWKNYEPYKHDRKSDAIGPFPGGYYFEEWFGIVGQGNGKNSPFLRQPRKTYYLYRDELWKKE